MYLIDENRSVQFALGSDSFDSFSGTYCVLWVFLFLDDMHTYKLGTFDVVGKVKMLVWKPGDSGFESCLQGENQLGDSPGDGEF